MIHGIPQAAGAKAGDVVSIDVGLASATATGGDAAVGLVSEEAARLRVTGDHLQAIDTVAGQADLRHRSQYGVGAGFSVVREFVGHGIGQSMHEEPQVPNYGERGRGPRLAEGMVLAIEPMVNAGKPAVKVLGDNWTAVTKDGSLSAHFEHTVAVTANGPWILTAREVPVAAR